MRKLRIALLKMGGTLAAVALFMGIASSQAICFTFFHQPKVPQGMSKFLGNR